MTQLTTPNGLAQIIQTFGDISKYVRADGTIDPKWEQNMVAVPIPFSIPLSWALSTKVSSIRVHKKLAPTLAATFQAIYDRGFAPLVQTYGGAYMYRPKRGSAKFSTHSWGIALDLNTATNQMGTKGDIDQRIVDVFRELGGGLGGFFIRYRFGVSDAASVTGARMFIGLAAATTAPTNVEPSALVNCIGIAQLSSSTNLQIVYGNATAKTAIDLGVNFPANSTSDAYELILFAPPEGGVNYQVTRLNTVYVATGFLASTDTPAASTLLCHQLWRTNNATALAVGLDVCGIYAETDY